MTRTRLVWVALAGGGAGLALGLSALVSLLLAPKSPGQLPDQPASVAYLLVGLVMTLVGVFLCLRKGENVISWIVLVGGFGLTLAAFVERYASLSGLPPQLPGGLLPLWIVQWIWLLPYGALIALLLLYPSGRLLSPRWRWAALATALLYGALAIRLAFGRMLIANAVGSGYVPNPAGFLPAMNPANTRFVLAALFGPVAVALVGLGARFRRAGDVERAQIKWLLFAGALFLCIAVPIEFLSWPAGGVLMNTAALGFPVAIAIAILRYRLFEIDVIIRRTTTYALITLFLGLVYLVAVVALQSAFSQVTGQGSTAAVVLSTLLIAALFLPVRRRVQAAIDRRFNRSRYDAELTLERFAATARDETDIDTLLAEVMHVIQETMQPESLSVWLREPKASSGHAGAPDAQQM